MHRAVENRKSQFIAALTTNTALLPDDKNKLTLESFNIFKANLSALDTVMNNEGDTFLHVAVQKGDAEVVAAFLKGINAQLSAGKQLREMAHGMASSAEKVAVLNAVKALRRKLKDVINIKNHIGDTPLHIAVKTGNTNIVRCLAEQKRNLHLQNANGEIPITMAYKLQQSEAHDILTAQSAENQRRKAWHAEVRKRVWKRYMHKNTKPDQFGYKDTQRIQFLPFSEGLYESISMKFLHKHYPEVYIKVSNKDGRYTTLPENDRTPKKDTYSPLETYKDGLEPDAYRYENLWQVYCTLSNKNELSYRMWIDMCRWYGLPKHLLKNTTQFLEESGRYFHGFVHDVEDKLANKPPTSFVLRYSGLIYANFTISSVPATGGKVRNTRISREEDGTYFYQNVQYPSVAAIITRLQTLHALSRDKYVLSDYAPIPKLGTSQKIIMPAKEENKKKNFDKLIKELDKAINIKDKEGVETLYRQLQNNISEWVKPEAKARSNPDHFGDISELDIAVKRMSLKEIAAQHIYQFVQNEEPRFLKYIPYIVYQHPDIKALLGDPCVQQIYLYCLQHKINIPKTIDNEEQLIKLNLTIRKNLMLTATALDLDIKKSYNQLSLVKTAVHSIQIFVREKDERFLEFMPAVLSCLPDELKDLLGHSCRQLIIGYCFRNGVDLSETLGGSTLLDKLNFVRKIRQDIMKTKPDSLEDRRKIQNEFAREDTKEKQKNIVLATKYNREMIAYKQQRDLYELMRNNENQTVASKHPNSLFHHSPQVQNESNTQSEISKSTQTDLLISDSLTMNHT